MNIKRIDEVQFRIFDHGECNAIQMKDIDTGETFWKLAIDQVWTSEEAPTLEEIKARAETYSDSADDIVWSVIDRMEEIGPNMTGLLYTTIGYYHACGRPPERVATAPETSGN